MGDPVTTGMMIGAVGGALTSKNPIQGAMMGGALGAAGGSMMGAGGGSTSPFSLGSILNGIGTNAAAGGDPTKGLAMNAAALAGSGGGFAGGGYGSIGTAGQTAGSASSGSSYIGGGFEPSFSGFGQGAMESIKGINKFANQNPVTTQLALRAANSLMEEPPVQMAPAGQVSRGQPQPMDYMSLLNPQHLWVYAVRHSWPVSWVSNIQ